MSSSYSIRELAQIDLEKIWFYTYNKWGIEQADNYLSLFFDRFEWLTENPLAGKNREEIKAGYYCFPEGRHLIFYTIFKKEISIIGIPHQSMDIDNHMHSV